MVKEKPSFLFQVQPSGHQRHLRPGHDVLLPVHGGRRERQPQAQRLCRLLLAQHELHAQLQGVLQPHHAAIRAEDIQVGVLWVSDNTCCSDCNSLDWTSMVIFLLIM